LRVAFAGTPEFALPALAALATHHQLVGVLTQPDRPKGRGRKLTASAVKMRAQALAVPLAQPPSLKSASAHAQLAAWAAEVLVVVAYGLILPREVLGLPRYGCLNIHASLLPRWRGAAPIQRAILAGDAETGISIMQMDAGLDTGPVFLQRRLAICAHHTAGMLHDELAAVGADALIEVLARLPGGLRATPQPEEGATYAPKIEKSEAQIDWGEAAVEIERKVRAFNPWPVAETRLNGEPLRILGARVVGREGDSPGSASNMKVNVEKIRGYGEIVEVRDDFIAVRCGRGILGVTEVQRAGRRPVKARDLSHSVPLQGLRLG
jgi:methionyl-tRNA formyltransferase